MVSSYCLSKCMGCGEAGCPKILLWIFFQVPNIISSVNQTNIALIPKKKLCEVCGDYRHISLTNVIYKIVTKLLASGLKTLLPNLIGWEQGAFLQGR